MVADEMQAIWKSGNTTSSLLGESRFAFAFGKYINAGTCRVG